MTTDLSHLDGQPRIETGEGYMSALLRGKIRAQAIGQIGAHYVWGGYGNRPGNTPDPNPFPGGFGRRVGLWPNSPTADISDHGRRQPIMNAAFTNIQGRIHICGGRFRRTDGRARADYLNSASSDQSIREALLWPRPNDRIDSNEIVWGENCVGVRHFDCVGFVNWCFWSVLGRPVEYSIAQWQSLGSERISQIATESLTEGDVLCAEHAGGEGNNSRHIGIYVGGGRVVHARSYTIGVEETPLSGGGTHWTYAGRPRVFAR